MRAIISILILTFLASCTEYTTRFPVSDETEASSYDHLLGDWIFYHHVGDSLDNQSDEFEPHGLRIMPFNSNEFVIEIIPEDSTVTAVEYVNDLHIIRAWITTIGEKQFLNLNPIGEKSDDTLFLLHKIKISSDTLISSTISKRLFKELSVEINSISDHYKFIKSAAGKSELWNLEYRYLRKK